MDVRLLLYLDDDDVGVLLPSSSFAPSSSAFFASAIDVVGRTGGGITTKCLGKKALAKSLEGLYRWSGPRVGYNWMVAMDPYNVMSADGGGGAS